VNKEIRHVTIGRIPSGRFIVTVWTRRKNRFRVVTAYPMNQEERERYELA
jgi:uncharacterized DUF497 family protein